METTSTTLMTAAADVATDELEVLMSKYQQHIQLQNVCCPAAYIIIVIIILPTTYMHACSIIHSPDGLVEPAAVKNGKYVKYDVVDAAEVAMFHFV